MKTILVPLPRRSSLLPDESLPSFLARLEKLNYYKPGTIRWLCRRDNKDNDEAEDASRPRQLVTFAQLATLTGLGVADLFAASDHRFALTLTPPEEDKQYITLQDRESHVLINPYACRKRIRPAFGVGFCPRCLTEAIYHRLNWTPVASTVCLVHKCLLVTQCPQCNKRVSVDEVVRKQCNKCKADLSQAQVHSVADDTVGMMSQRFLQFWLTVAPKPTLTEGHTLPDNPPMVMYRLLDGLCSSLIACWADWPNLPVPLAGLPESIPENITPAQVLPPASSYHLYRTAFQAILDWPQGFYHFLDAYRQRNSKAQTARCLNSLFGSLFANWFQKAWLNPEFEFIQHAFGGYLLSGRISLAYALKSERFKNDSRLADQRGLLSQEQTMQALGISAGALNRFARSGCLCQASVRVGELVLFKRDAVSETEQRWRKCLSLEEACCWLRLSEGVVIELTRRGVLTLCEGNPDSTTTEWRIEKQSLVALIEAVERHLSPMDSADGPLIPLSAASQYLGSVRLDSAAILKRVMDGQLIGYTSQRWTGNLSLIRFLESTIESLLETIPTEQGWVTDSEIATRLGISVKVFRYSLWIHSDLEPAGRRGDVLYFDPHHVDSFCADCVTGEEAAQMLGVDMETLLQVHSWWITPFTDPPYDGSPYFLFRRHHVERFMPNC